MDTKLTQTTPRDLIRESLGLKQGKYAASDRFVSCDRATTAAVCFYRYKSWCGSLYLVVAELRSLVQATPRGCGVLLYIVTT